MSGKRTEREPVQESLLQPATKARPTGPPAPRRQILTEEQRQRGRWASWVYGQGKPPPEYAGKPDKNGPGAPAAKAETPEP